MQTIKIDEKEYQLDELSDEIKAQLVSLQFVNNEIIRLNAQLAAIQTARIAYSRAIKDLLEEGSMPSEDDISIEGLGDTLSFD